MNGLGNEGAISVAGIIKDNNNLQELYISYNRIGRQGALAIGKELESNETLKVLKMDHNPIGSDAANAVLRGVFPAKSSLFDLDLSAVEVDKEFLSLLKEIKSTRCVNVCHGSVIGDYKLKWKPKKRFPEGQLFMVPIEEVTPSNLMSVIRKYSDEYNVQVYEAVVSLDKENVGRVGKATLIEALKVAEIGFSESQKEALENVIGDLPPEETLDYSALKQ